MTLYRLADDPPTLVDPVMIACFDGWVDAAEAASSAVAHVAADAEPMVTFDPDAIFDYRSRRPVLDVQDGRLSDLRWPELAIRHVSVDGRDLLIFSGAEPDLRWQELASDVATLVASLGVALWVSLGAVPGAVAHTMPVPVMATASEDGLLSPRTPPGPEGLLRVPSAALSAMEMAVRDPASPPSDSSPRCRPTPASATPPPASRCWSGSAATSRSTCRWTTCTTRSTSNDPATTRPWPATPCCARPSSSWSRWRATWRSTTCRPATSWRARSSGSCDTTTRTVRPECWF